MRRIVVAVDPSGTSGPGARAGDDIGIVVVGLGVDDRCYVLEDASCNLSPEGWARRVRQAKYAAALELGTSRMEARPYLRPARDSQVPRITGNDRSMRELEGGALAGL